MSVPETQPYVSDEHLSGDGYPRRGRNGRGSCQVNPVVQNPVSRQLCKYANSAFQTNLKFRITQR